MEFLHKEILGMDSEATPHKENVNTVNISMSSTTSRGLSDVTKRRSTMTDHLEGNAQREVKKLKSVLQDKDKQISLLEKQLHSTRGQLESLHIQELKHKNISREARRMLSSQETSVRAKTAALTRINNQLQRLSNVEQNRLRRKNLQLKELSQEFEQMEDNYESQITTLEEEISSMRSAQDEMEAQFAEKVAKLMLDLEKAQGEKEIYESLRIQVITAQSERDHAIQMLDGAQERVSHFSRELERNQCIQKLQLLAVQQKYKTLCLAASSSHNDAEAAKSSHSKLNMELEQLTKKCAKAEDLLEAMKEEKINDNLRIHSLSLTVKKAQETEESLKAELDSVREDLAKAIESLASSEAECTTRLAKLQETIGADKHHYQTQLADRDAVVAALQLRCEELQQESSAFAAGLGAERDRTAALSAELSALERMSSEGVNGLQATVRDLTAQLQADRFMHEDELQQMRSDQCATNVRHSMEINDLQQLLEQIRESHNSIMINDQAMKLELDDLKEKTAFMVKEKESREYSHAAEMENQRLLYIQEIEATKQEFESKQREIEAVITKSVMNEHNETDVDVQVLQGTLANIKTEYAQLKLQCDNERIQGAKSIQAVKTLYDGVSSQLQDTTAKLEYLQSAFKAMELDNSSTIEMCNRLERENSELKLKLNSRRFKKNEK
jgi:DNA repair exonuclease SbcCD ATPase subunit